MSTYTVSAADITRFASEHVNVYRQAKAGDRVEKVIVGTIFDVHNIITVVYEPAFHTVVQSEDASFGFKLNNGDVTDRGFRFKRASPDGQVFIFEFPQTTARVTGLSIPAGVAYTDGQSLAYRVTEADVAEWEKWGYHLEIHNGASAPAVAGSPIMRGAVLFFTSDNPTTDWDDSDPSYLIAGGQHIPFVSEDLWGEKVQALRNFPASDPVEGIKLVTVSSKAKSYVFTTADLTKISGRGCAATIDDTPIVADMALMRGQTLKIVADVNHAFFRTTPDAGGMKGLGSVYFDAANDITEFTFSDDMKTATYVADRILEAGSLVIHTKVTTTNPGGGGEIHSKAAFNNIYEMTVEKFSDVNRNRFVMESSTGNPAGMYDFGQYIVSLVKFPFPLKAEWLSVEDKVVLGNKQINVTANRINTDEFIHDLGIITVPIIYGDVRDFIGATAKIHLPFSDPVELPIEYVIGHEVNVKYAFSVYDGTALITISTDAAKGPIISKKVNAGFEVPYINWGETRSVDNPRVEFGLDNGILKPFIEIMRPDFTDARSDLNPTVTVNERMGDQTGYVEVQHINIRLNATQTERDMLDSALQAGVVIE